MECSFKGVWKMNRTTALSDRKYPELERRMVEEGISKTRIAETLGISLRSVVKKCMGESRFTWEEALCIQESFFPQDNLKQLFQKKD